MAYVQVLTLDDINNFIQEEQQKKPTIISHEVSEYADFNETGYDMWSDFYPMALGKVLFSDYFEINIRELPYEYRPIEYVRSGDTIVARTICMDNRVEFTFTPSQITVRKSSKKFKMKRFYYTEILTFDSLDYPLDMELTITIPEYCQFIWDVVSDTKIPSYNKQIIDTSLCLLGLFMEHVVEYEKYPEIIPCKKTINVKDYQFKYDSTNIDYIIDEYIILPRYCRKLLDAAVRWALEYPKRHMNAIVNNIPYEPKFGTIYKEAQSDFEEQVIGIKDDSFDSDGDDVRMAISI